MFLGRFKTVRGHFAVAALGQTPGAAKRDIIASGGKPRRLPRPRRKRSVPNHQRLSIRQAQGAAGRRAQRAISVRNPWEAARCRVPGRQQVKTEMFACKQTMASTQTSYPTNLTQTSHASHTSQTITPGLADSSCPGTQCTPPIASKHQQCSIDAPVFSTRGV